MDKQGLDCFSPGKSVPGFELALEWTVSDQQPQSLSQPITLKGTKGDTYFTLRISNPLTLPVSDSGKIDEPSDTINKCSSLLVLGGGGGGDVGEGAVGE